jgi:biopolymer transport protein ExbD
MSHGGGASSAGVEVNLIPMIDIVIQLITFFLMLVNFDEANQDERVRLPVADLAKPTAMDVEEMLIWNLNDDGRVKVLGEPIDVDDNAFRQAVAREAAAAERSMKKAGREPKTVAGRPQLWTTIMIRADRDVEYAKVQHLIKICQDYGFYKFALRATPERK